MERRDFLKLMATFGCWLLMEDMPRVASAKRTYHHIVIISDTHLPWREKNYPDKEAQALIGKEKKHMLANINSWDDVDEVALLGDLAARYGTEEEFRSVDEFITHLPFPTYIIAGNHDYAYRNKPTKKGKLKHGTYEEKKTKLLAFAKRYNLPSLYYGRTVKDCRLLYLAPDACGGNVELSEAQLLWMKNEIAMHQNTPILFFCHAPLMGTLRSYHKSINTPKSVVLPIEPLREILADTPKGSLWISGHTHTPPTNESFADMSVNRFNKNLLNIHTPSIDKPHVYTNSLYIFDDRILVRTYDHTKEMWLSRLDRTISGSLITQGAKPPA